MLENFVRVLIEYMQRNGLSDDALRDECRSKLNIDITVPSPQPAPQMPSASVQDTAAAGHAFGGSECHPSAHSRRVYTLPRSNTDHLYHPVIHPSIPPSPISTPPLSRGQSERPSSRHTIGSLQSVQESLSSSSARLAALESIVEEDVGVSPPIPRDLPQPVIPLPGTYLHDERRGIGR
jgi:hypothetical protein